MCVCVARMNLTKNGVKFVFGDGQGSRVKGHGHGSDGSRVKGQRSWS